MGKPRQKSTTKGKARLVALDIDALLKMPKPRFIIDGVIPQDAIVIWHGPPNAGKTTLGIDCAASVWCRAQWLGQRVIAPGASLMVCGEGIASYVARLSAWRDHYGETPAGVHVVPRAIDLLDPHDVTEIKRLAVRIEPQLIWLDTLSRCHSADENSTVEMRRVMNALVEIQRHAEATVIALHHPGHSNTRRGRGSSVIPADADTVIDIHKAAKGECGELRCLKQRDAAPFAPIGYRLVPVGDSVIAEGTETVLTSEHQALLASLDGQGLTAGAWEKLSELPHRTFHRRLRALVDAGAVRHEGAVYVRAR